MLGKIKRLLGIGQSSEDDGSSAETSVTVERERGSDAGPDAASEADAEGAETPDEGNDDVEGADSERDGAEAEGSPAEADVDSDGAEDVEDDEVDEPVATDTDASGSTESIVDEEAASEDAATKAEPSQAAGPESEDVTTDMDAVGPDADAEPEPDEGVPVDNVKGIGPAYADRLSEIGIDSVADLADADAAEVAEGTTVSESRVQRWIDRAKEYDS